MASSSAGVAVESGGQATERKQGKPGRHCSSSKEYLPHHKRRPAVPMKRRVALTNRGESLSSLEPDIPPRQRSPGVSPN